MKEYIVYFLENILYALFCGVNVLYLWYDFSYKYSLFPDQGPEATGLPDPSQVNSGEIDPYAAQINAAQVNSGMLYFIYSFYSLLFS